MVNFPINQMSSTTAENQPSQPENDPSPWDRRDFMRLLGGSASASSLAPLLSGCSKEDPEQTPSNTSSLPDPLPFAAWKKMREALRRSPDHLTSRCEEIVATKDPQAIFEFVRDHFLTRPDRYRGGSDIDFRDRVNWGLPGVLRSGVGTPREKAELLQSLYTRAGFKARIMEGQMDIGSISLSRLFFNKQRPPFDPDETIAPLEEWKELLQSEDSFLHDDEGQLKAIDFSTLGEATILEEIKSALGSEFQPASPKWSHLLRNTSIVAVNVDGKERFANPHLSDLPFGEHGLKSTPRPAGRQEPMETPEVKVTLSAATTSNPHERFPLVEGSWRAADLVGRQLKINFMSTEEPEVLLRSRLRDLETFIPVLSVQSENLSEDEVRKLSFAGDLITVHGDQISSQDKQILVNQEPVSITTGKPENIKQIARLELAA